MIIETIKLVSLKNEIHVTLGTLAKIDTRKLRKTEDWDRMIFPRLLIYAERAWHKSPWEETVNPFKQNRTRRHHFDDPIWTDVDMEERRVLGCISTKELAKLARYNISAYVEEPGAM